MQFFFLVLAANDRTLFNERECYKFSRESVAQNWILAQSARIFSVVYSNYEISLISFCRL